MAQDEDKAVFSNGRSRVGRDRLNRVLAMDNKIFRQQALDAQEKFGLGSVRIQKMPLQSIIIFLVIILCVSVFLFISVASFTNRTTVKGVLQTQQGVSKVYAEIDGIIKTLHVKEGDRVHKGQSLLVIEPQISSQEKLNINEALSINLENQTRISREETNKLVQKRISIQTAHEKKRRSLEGELEKLNNELRINEQQIKVQISIKQKLETLLMSDYVSSLDYQMTEKELLSLKLARSRLERQIINFKQSLDDAKNNLELQLNEIEIQALGLERLGSNLEKQGLQHKSNKGRLITSPADGYVTNLVIHDSQLVRPNEELLTITPLNDKLLAHLYIPTQSSGLIKTRQAVNLRINAFPYQKYGTFKGEISSISRNPINAADTYSNKDAMFLARVELTHQGLKDGKQHYSLRPGMQIEADVMLDKRLILDLIFDPVRRVIDKI